MFENLQNGQFVNGDSERLSEAITVGGMAQSKWVNYELWWSTSRCRSDDQNQRIISLYLLDISLKL